MKCKRTNLLCYLLNKSNKKLYFTTSIELFHTDTGISHTFSNNNDLNFIESLY